MDELILVLALILFWQAWDALKNPMDMRAAATAREWEQNPEQAREKQQRFAYIMAVMAAGGGILLICLYIVAKIYL